MYRLASCIALDHNPALAAIALLICATGSLVVARLLRRTIGSRGRQRVAWILISAIAAGSTTWCTHFVAMLAYQPNVDIAYAPAPTVLSLIVAIVGGIAAFGIASEDGRHAPLLGGATFGVTVAAMHYTGMMAVTVGAVVDFRASFVIASIVISVAFAAPAFRHLARGGEGIRPAVVGAVVIALGILALHFLGMAAIDITPLAGAGELTVAVVTREPLAYAVAGVGLLILGTGAVTYVIDSEAAVTTATRLKHLTESAVDGMALVRGGEIVEVNAEFERMTRRSRAELIGRTMRELIEPECVPESELVAAALRVGDTLLPVELAVCTEPTGRDGLPITVYALRDISERLAQQQRIEFLALYDGLTGLANRTAFIKEATRILSSQSGGGRIALFALDIDHFKQINDSHGHAAGDAVLREIGRRLSLLMEPSQLAARLDGDEFVVLAPMPSRDRAVEFAEVIAAILAGPLQFKEKELVCTVAIGIAFFPADGLEVQTLLNNADPALARAKALEENKICLYERSMDDAVRAQRSLVEDLRRAIDNDELTLFYQVQMAIETDTIAGYEALVRWTHPLRGPVSPSEFIPLAERAGLIPRLGERVFQAACREAATWLPGPTVSINVSPLQLDDPRFVEMVHAALKDTGVDPSRVEIEVTEHSFIADEVRAKRVLERLKALGLSVAIDDFGVGYSSMAMLQAFPFDKIKLDKLFVDRIAGDKKAQGILRAVLSLGEALGVSVLAEGVETMDQLQHLRAQQCPLVQGYIYGRPQPRIDKRFYREPGPEIRAAVA